MSAPALLAECVGPVLRDLARRSGKDLSRWLEQVHRLGGCTEPVRLVGETMTLDAASGEIVSSYSTAGEPHGHLLVRCGNRRASRCPSCAELYRRDTFHLIRAGLLGGAKGVPASVRAHPRVFVTLTAPSFGPVHRGPDKSGVRRVCHPRRTGPTCFERHKSDDGRIGQPLDLDSYDYVGHVLWNAHAGELWRRFTIYLRRHLAAAAGLTQSAFNKAVRVSFAKVAEYQARGVVHFHGVVRLDGRTTEPADVVEPPPWATLELLETAISSAVAAVRVKAPDVGQPTKELVWGRQVDVKPIETGDLDGHLSEQAVAAYIAKYATKAAETSGTLDRRIHAHDLSRLREQGASSHAARLIRTAWRLGNPESYPELTGLRLRKWAHMLGFRGHFSTRSRAYSTTLGAVRDERADYRRAQSVHGGAELPEESTLVLAHWSFAGQGYTAGESLLATSIINGPPGMTARREVDP
ncbi:replication initiator [Nonomuraea basaltis]|uniref:replication initiator n=1 Tax=Nonomuraea basaltis TaxID=2495887 RepID=UPI00110C4FDE|nr:replication initiator [Nonomuraea basaltis]TMR99969.1 replication initiation protein [Nonomuraea basaltis]